MHAIGESSMDITDLASKEQLREWIEALGLVLVSYELWIQVGAS